MQRLAEKQSLDFSTQPYKIRHVVAVNVCTLICPSKPQPRCGPAA